MPRCHHCQAEIVVVDRVGRRDTCPSCESDLHCCLNCTFYDPDASKACREPDVELVKDKERGNFCEYFVLGEPAKRPQSGKSGQTQAAAARAELEALFRKKQ